MLINYYGSLGETNKIYTYFIMVVNIEIEELPPSKRGRKKKYATADEARKAKLAQTKASNQRKKGGLVWKEQLTLFLENNTQD